MRPGYRVLDEYSAAGRCAQLFVDDNAMVAPALMLDDRFSARGPMGVQNWALGVRSLKLRRNCTPPCLSSLKFQPFVFVVVLVIVNKKGNESGTRVNGYKKF